MIHRRQFFKHVAAGAIAAAVMLPSGPRSEAQPPAGKTVVGTRYQGVNLRALLCGSGKGQCSTPALLRDGRYALPATALTDPAYSAVADLLATWDEIEVKTTDYESDGDAFLVSIDGKFMRHAGRPASLTMPHPEIFRFQVQANDFAGSYDSESGSRRSEVVARQQDGTGEGTVWASFCLVLGSTPGLATAGRGIVHQWHSVDRDVGRTPVLFIDVAESQLTVRTCSSARLYGDKAAGSQHPENGISVAHYTTEVPARGEMTYITLKATFGEHGQLTVWINGERVVETDTPIGYYADLSDGSGRTILGYPHWGLYTTNQPETQIVYIANPEWGTESLSARVTNPREVPRLAW